MSESHEHRLEEVTCREFVGLVTDYWDDALPAARLELVEEHLVMCDWCKTYLDQMRSTVEAMPATAEPGQLPAETEETLMAAFREWRQRH
jgi:predicted anti-sigma-YlaC factor YlaD